MPFVQSKQDGSTLMVSFDRDYLVEQAVIDGVRREVADLVESSRPEKVVLDFARLKFMSSSGLGMLVKIHRACAESHAKLRLAHVNRNIREILAIVRLDRLLKIEPDDPPTAGGVFAKIKPKPSGDAAACDDPDEEE